MAQLTHKFGTLTDIITRREQYDLEAKATKEMGKKDKDSGAKNSKNSHPSSKTS